MCKEKIFEQVKNVVAEELGVNLEQIELDSDIEYDLGADRDDVLSLLMAIEEEFEIEIDDDDEKWINILFSCSHRDTKAREAEQVYGLFNALFGGSNNKTANEPIPRRDCSIRYVVDLILEKLEQPETKIII